MMQRIAFDCVFTLSKSDFKTATMKLFSISIAIFTLAFSTSLSAQTPCVDGMAGGYPCENIDLLSFMPGSALGGGDMNDVWGWTDPIYGTEYVLLGRTSGTSFVDISNPVNPVYLGNLPASGSNSAWRDIKVDGDFAYIVSEASGHGMQIFDLTKLRDVTSPPVTFSEDAHYSGWGNAHNIVINEDTHRAYGVGTNTSSGGLHIVDISNPLNPTIMGDFASDGYTHDAQVVVYNGPDSNYSGKEIAFACNENTVTIVDVTDPGDAVQLGSGTYNSNYTHQGWLTEDHKYFLSNDELDEYYNGVNTTTFIWDVQDLNAPFLLGTYVAETAAIDHNLYIKDNLCYQSNYRAGLRITSLDDVANGNLTEVGFFDVYPASNSAAFNGTWSNFPYFASGVVAVSHIEDGLFLLQPNISNFHLTVDNDFVCFNESVTFTLSSNDLGLYDSIEFGGNMPGTSTTSTNADGSMSILFSDLPQGALQAFNLTVNAYLNGTIVESASVEVTIYDCINEVFGCTDFMALNFNSSATIDDGSCEFPCLDITFTLLTDNYPGETTWDITDADGVIVLSGGPYSENQTEFVVTSCLEYGCYALNVHDTYGDGMSWNGVDGYYLLIETASEIVLAEIISGSNFGTEATHPFCLEGDTTTCLGDLNSDGVITVADILLVLSDFGCTSNCSADIDNDGAVTVADVLALLSLFGQAC